MSADKVYMLSDDEGRPVAMASLRAVNELGDRLAYRLAAVSDRPAELERIVAETVAELGPRQTGHVGMAALGRVIEDVVRPLVALAEHVGVSVRERLAELAEVPPAPCAVCQHDHGIFELVGVRVRCSGQRAGSAS